jgi:hypothetical protein
MECIEVLMTRTKRQVFEIGILCLKDSITLVGRNSDHCSSTTMAFLRAKQAPSDPAKIKFPLSSNAKFHKFTDSKASHGVQSFHKQAKQFSRANKSTKWQ